MSRSRRRQQSKSSSSSTKKSKKNNLSTWVLRFIFVALLVVAGASVTGYFWLRNFLASEKFRQQIIAESSKLLKADVSVSPLRWDGFRVNSDSIEATGTQQCKSMKFDGIRTGIEIGSVTQGIWKVSPTRIGRVSMVWDATVKESPAEVATEPQVLPTTPQVQPWYQSWIPKKYATHSIIVDDTDIRAILANGNVRLTDMRLEIDPSDDLPQAKMSMSGGQLTLPYPAVPEIRINKAAASYRNGFVYLSNLDAYAYKNGHLQLSGEWEQATKSLQLAGEVDEVQCDEFLPYDWKQKLMGTVHATTSMKYADNKITADGHLEIKNGVLTALRILDELAAYSQSVRFRTLTLHSAECDFRYENDVISLTNIQIGSEGLARLEGSCKFTPLANGDTAIDGSFRLGLAPGTLSIIPGAEEEVFLPGPRGLRWAPMRLTGTVQSPKEDLGDRLLAVASARMFDIIPGTGNKVLKYTQDVFSDKTNPLTTGGAIIEKGTNIAKDGIGKTTGVAGEVLDTVTSGAETAVTGAVNGLLGGVLGEKEETPQPPKRKLEPEK